MKTTKFLIPLIFSTILPVLTVSPARAEWEYTRWGMTPQDVQKASRGAAVLVNPKEQSTTKGKWTLLKSDWSVGRYPFKVFFNFSSGKPQLTEVLLVSTGYNQDLGQKLIEKYGPPTTVQGGLRQNSRDRKFILTQRDNYAVPETERGASPTPLAES